MIFHTDDHDGRCNYTLMVVGYSGDDGSCVGSGYGIV